MSSENEVGPVLEFCCFGLVVWGLAQGFLNHVVPAMERLWTVTLYPLLAEVAVFLLYSGAVVVGILVLWQIIVRVRRFFLTNKANLTRRCIDLDEHIEQLQKALEDATISPASVVEEAINSIVKGHR